jgi:autotransporter translocation and assembly factor TamB
MTRQRLLLAAVALVVALVTTAIVGALAVSAGFQRERVRRSLELALSRALETPVRVAALEGPLLPTATVRGLSVGDAEAPLLEVGQATARLDRVDLLDPRLVFSRVEASGVRLRVAESAGIETDELDWFARLEIASGTFSDLEVRLSAPGGRRVVARGEARVRGLAWPPENRRAVETGRFAGDARLENAEGVVVAKASLESGFEGDRIELTRLVLEAGQRRASLAHPARLRLAEGVLSIESLELASDVGSLAVSGGLAPEGFADFDVDARAVPVEIVGALIPGLGDARGWIDARLSLDGSLERPQVQAQGAVRELAIGSVRDAAIRFSARTHERIVQVAADVELAGRPAATVRADLPLGAPPRTWLTSSDFRARLESQALDASLLQSLWPEEARLAGTLDLDLDLAGGAAGGLSGFVRLRDGRLEGSALAAPVEPISLDVALRPDPQGVAVESFHASSPLGELDCSGWLSQELDAQLDLVFSNVAAAALVKTFGASWEGGGVIAGEAQIRGALARPDVALSARWSDAAVATARADAIVAEASLEGERLDASARVFGLDRRLLVVTAEGPRPTTASLEGLLASGTRVDVMGEDFDLALLSPVLPRQLRNVGGRADLAVEIRGGEQTPALSGQLRVQNGTLEVPLLGRTFEPVEGRVEITERAFRPAIAIGAPEAGARIQGEVALARLRPVAADLTLVLERMPLARSRLLSVDATGALQLEGAVDALALTGDLRFDDARVRVPSADDPTLREIRIAVADTQRGDLDSLSERKRAPDAIDRARVDVRVALPRGSWVRGRGIELELEGDVVLRKPPLAPGGYSGDVRVVRGRYEVYGKRFDLRSGVATFDGSERFDPLIDVEGEHRVRDVRILAHLTGRASNPTLQLSSDPPLSETDTLSYLMIGRPASGDDQEGQGFDQAAASLAAGVAAAELALLLPGPGLVDTVDFRIGESGTPEEVEVGRYLMDDLFVRYGRGFGEDPKDRVGIELRLDEHWSIESEMTTDQSAGADLIWSTDF